jgi:hypothetical protein
MSETTAADAIRGDELYRGVLAPLLLGGPLRPVRPIGPSLARRIAALAGVFRCSDSLVQARCEEARLRRARVLAPLDQLPPMDTPQWLLLAAFNDLLQAANPRLPSVVAPSRPQKLLRACDVLLSLVPPPADPLGALARHVTLGNALDVYRLDTQVRWWTGSALFRGVPPTQRLLAWPDLRRVQISETPVPVEQLPLPGAPRESYLAVLALWLKLSPLTDLATAARSDPPFRWTLPTLTLLGVPAGQRLARRVLAGLNARGEVALERATHELESKAPAAFALATRFLEDRRALAARSA